MPQAVLFVVVDPPREAILIDIETERKLAWKRARRELISPEPKTGDIDPGLITLLAPILKGLPRLVEKFDRFA